jgi:SAM-dependent methyltransferase
VTAGAISYEISDTDDINSSAYIERAILDSGARRVVDIGGGANPLVPLDFVTAHDITYTILDISADELAKAPAGYLTMQADIGAGELAGGGDHDLVISKMLAEHIDDAEAFHRNVYGLLRPGGRAIHLFPTLYAPPFVVNRVIPESVSRSVLRRLSGRERVRDGELRKFPAYYHWCRGPIPRQLARLEHIGFEVERYIGYFGSTAYFTRFPRLASADSAVARWLVRHPAPWITTYARVTLRKPLDATRAASASSRPGAARRRRQALRTTHV